LSQEIGGGFLGHGCFSLILVAGAVGVNISLVDPTVLISNTNTYGQIGHDFHHDQPENFLLPSLTPWPVSFWDTSLTSIVPQLLQL